MEKQKQSSFFDLVEPEETKPELEVKAKEEKPKEEEAVIIPIPKAAEPEFYEIPKRITGTLICPDCKSKARLRPDGSVVCLKCTEKILIKKEVKNGATTKF